MTDKPTFEEWVKGLGITLTPHQRQLCEELSRNGPTKLVISRKNRVPMRVLAHANRIIKAAINSLRLDGKDDENEPDNPIENLERP